MVSYPHLFKLDLLERVKLGGMKITKENVVSTLNTFLATFIAVLGVQLSSGMPIEWTATFWFPVLVAAVRAGVKAIVSRHV